MAEAVHDRWLPFGTRVSDRIVVGHIIASGADWQVARVTQGGHALIVRKDLRDRWLKEGLLSAGHLASYGFGGEHLYVIDGGTDHVLTPLSRCESPQSKSAAMSFAKAMRATRVAGSSPSLGDGIFVERLSRILPTYGSASDVEDAVVLGTWLTGGLPVDVRSAQLTDLLTWISPRHLLDVLEAAGFERGDEAVEAFSGGLLSEDRGSDTGVESGQRFSLPGRAALETFFNDHVVDVVQNSDRYRALGLLHPPSIILAGPPGCGKTVGVEKLVEFLGWPSFSIQADSVASPFIHETSRKIGELFQRAIDTAPSVLIIDEMDAFLAERDAAPASSHKVEEIAEFLRRIPDAAKAGVLVVGMTNRLDAIDAAVLRRGRFDHVVKVDFATETEVTALLKFLTTGLPLASDVDLEGFGARLAGRPLSDAAFVVREAARLAAKKRSASIDLMSLEGALAATLVQDRSTERHPIGFIRMKDR